MLVPKESPLVLLDDGANICLRSIFESPTRPFLMGIATGVCIMVLWVQVYKAEQVTIKRSAPAGRGPRSMGLDITSIYLKVILFLHLMCKKTQTSATNAKKCEKSSETCKNAKKSANACKNMQTCKKTNKYNQVLKCKKCKNT